ncbi:uncharacterized protein LOC135345275 [Halichondria panicea]|uniref:uncharacterized protein LOC135345275 n=1 Tax=Halichondria panicea TaxID=6063 RepID=UPI00312B4095
MTLDLEEYQQQAIRVYPLLEYLHKTVEVLKVWKKNSVQEATYLRLVEACLEMSNALLAGEVCTLAKFAAATTLGRGPFAPVVTIRTEEYAPSGPPLTVVATAISHLPHMAATL